MPHDQQDPTDIVDKLAGGDVASTLLDDLTDDQLAAVGRIAVQRRRDDQEVIGRIAAEYHRHRGKSWREIAAELAMESHMTARRWAGPFLPAP